MRLKNKKTGEIGNLVQRGCEDERIWVWVDNISKPAYRYNSLAELNEEWEDVSEEPKDNNYWYIDDFGRIQFSSEVLDEIEEHPNNWMARKLFGNYFETKEEAKQAVEKLKAWKRLKDKGFRFTANTLYEKSRCGDVTFDIDDIGGSAREDLDLLFGGEE